MTGLLPKPVQLSGIDSSAQREESAEDSAGVVSFSLVAASAHPNPNHKYADQRDGNGDKLFDGHPPLLGRPAVPARPSPRATVELPSSVRPLTSFPTPP